MVGVSLAGDQREGVARISVFLKNLWTCVSATLDELSQKLWQKRNEECDCTVREIDPRIWGKESVGLRIPGFVDLIEGNVTAGLAKKCLSSGHIAYS